MERITDSKFVELSKAEMEALHGGKWNVWKTDIIDGVTFEQRYNIFGLHATGDTRNPRCDD